MIVRRTLAISRFAELGLEQHQAEQVERLVQVLLEDVEADPDVILGDRARTVSRRGIR